MPLSINHHDDLCLYDPQLPFFFQISLQKVSQFLRSPSCCQSTFPSDVPLSSTFSPGTEELSVNSSSNMSYSFLLNSSVDNALTTIHHDKEFLLQEIIDEPQQPILEPIPTAAPTPTSTPPPPPAPTPAPTAALMKHSTQHSLY
jgi:hypothetical protein